MDRVGKVSRDCLETTILGRLGADRSDVRLGPRHGADFGVIDVGEQAVAIATDPLFVPLELGVERAAWYAFHIGVADVVLSGLSPSHLAVTLSLPPGTGRDTLDSLMTVFDEEAQALDTAIVTGHTGHYEGVAWPYVGGLTGVAVGEPARLVLPTGARPGDAIIVTKGPAIETVGVLATRYGEQLDIPEEQVQAAKQRFWEISTVPDALAAAGTNRVTAMHDATERGIDNALHELAAAADVHLTVERDKFPQGEGVAAVCEALDIDPWQASSEGSIIMTVAPDGVDEVLDAVSDAGVRAAQVGTVMRGSGVTVDGESLAEPQTDPFWEAYTRLQEEST